MKSGYGFVNRSLGKRLFDDSLNKNALISDIIEPLLLIAGILSNLVLIAIIFKKKHTESFRSHKPLRYLLIVILICDLWYLISELNVKIFKFGTWPDLTSFNYFCQLHSYLYYFFAVLIEFSMLSANYIVACLIHLPKRQNKSSIDVYNDFIISENDATNLGRGGNFRTRSVRRLRGMFLRSNSEPAEKIARQVSGDNLAQSVKSRNKRASLGANTKMLSGKNVNIEAVANISAVTHESETNRLVRSTNAPDGAQSSLSNRISLINEINRRERLNQCRANAHSLVYPLKIESDDTYFNLAFKEKFFIILSIFVCMYFLSFFLWIQGVENLDNSLASNYDITLKLHTKPHLRLNPKGFMASKSQQQSAPSVFSSNKSDFDKQLEELFAEPLPSFASYLTVVSTTAVPKSPSPFSPPRFSSDSLQVCKTHKFATNFLRYFLLFLSLLRLATLCINLVVSVCFCVRFKADLMQALFSSFKKHDDTFYSKSKLIKFKSFKFTLITDCEQPVNGQVGNSNVKKSLVSKSCQMNPSDSSRQVSHMDMECTTTTNNEVDSNANSDSSHIRANVFRRFKRDRIKLLANNSQNQHKMYYSHLHFVRHHITTIAFYSFLISFGVINEINTLYLDWGARADLAPGPYSSGNLALDNILESNGSSSFSFDMIRARMNTTLPPATTVPPPPTTLGPRATAAANTTTRLALKSKSMIEKIIDMESDMRESLNFQTLINLTTILAHSTKLLIYLIFSAHIKCFVKLNRPGARNNQIRDDV